MKNTQLRIVTDRGDVIYEVEVPTCKQEYSQGLADRDHVAFGTGMLYDYHENPREVSMYTPDTRIPVDFIFIDKKGQILKIATAQPLSRELHKAKNTAWILEINGGEANRKGIQVGDVVCGPLLGTENAFHSDFPADVESCRHYESQVFVKTKKTELMYSYISHSWGDTCIDPNIRSIFERKIENYRLQNIYPAFMTEEETKKHIKFYEQKYKEDFRRTRSHFFVRNHECIIKVSPLEDKISMYIYGKGWEEMEWWDEDKEGLLSGIYISSVKITSQEAEEIIKSIEASKSKMKEVNSRNEEFVDKPDFNGEHYEALGNVWASVESKNLAGYITELIEKIVFSIKKGSPLSEKERSFLQYMMTIYCDLGVFLGFSPKINEDIQIAVLLKEQKDCLEFLSAYPFMKGHPNEVTIQGYHTWGNDIEGVFTADFHDKTTVAWFDPFYLYAKNANLLHKKAEIMFSALALKLEKSKSNVITVDQGALFQLQLEEFLKKNPGKTAADMPPVRVELGKCSVFVPTQYVSEYEYQAEIKHVKSCRLGDKKAYQMEINVMRDLEDDVGFTLNLYAFEHVLKGYKPKKGDFVRGILWLQGYYLPSDEKAK